MSGLNKAVACGVVLLTHIAAFAALVGPPPIDKVVRAEPFVTTASVEIESDSSTWDTTPLPDLKLVNPKLDDAGIEVVSFQDLEDNEAVVGAASVPRLSRVQAISPESIALKNRLTIKQAQTVVLAISVAEDGQVGDVKVARSCGRTDVDSAAIEYARTLHWIPGTKDHKPQAMRITLPVIFS